jgi:hypothetical protein
VILSHLYTTAPIRYTVPATKRNNDTEIRNFGLREAGSIDYYNVSVQYADVYVYSTNLQSGMVAIASKVYCAQDNITQRPMAVTWVQYIAKAYEKNTIKQRQTDVSVN